MDTSSALPKHFACDSAQGVYENEPVAQFELGSHRNFVYAVLDWETKQAALIDPQSDIDTPLGQMGRWGFTLSSVLLTHSHFDHTAGMPGLLERFPGIPVFAHEAEMKRLRKLRNIRHHPIEDGTQIAIGNQSALVIQVIHTPGHSAGECCYLLQADRNYLFTGDMLFLGDCGRTDLEGGSTQQMFESLQKLRRLGASLGNAIVLPGHHYSQACASTLQYEIQNSQPFQCQSSQDLERLP